MFCRKCGNKILDDSLFCHNCGEKVIQLQDQRNIPDNTSSSFDSEPVSADINEIPTSPSNNTNNKNTVKTTIKIIVPIAIIAIIIVAIVSSINNSKRCEYTSCPNDKVQGGKYCYIHTCTVSGCFNRKAYDSDYCYSHKCKCSSTLCKNKKMDGSEYCKEHTCSTPGCFKEVQSGTSNCSEHQVDMRKRLTSSSFWFSLDSAGGIDFHFDATNSSGKTIKYIRFNVYLRNRVGDLINDDIKRRNYCEVEIIGPFESGKKISFRKDNIGYCDDLYRIDINDITLVYSDGSKETGAFNYYTTK